MNPYDKLAVGFVVLLTLSLVVTAVRAMRRDSGIPRKK